MWLDSERLVGIKRMGLFSKTVQSHGTDMFAEFCFMVFLFIDCYRG